VGDACAHQLIFGIFGVDVNQVQVAREHRKPHDVRLCEVRPTLVMLLLLQILGIKVGGNPVERAVVRAFDDALSVLFLGPTEAAMFAQ